ncbi:MAG: hypothetical protein CFE45_26305 [Burkholderiales bacterium PBB5]|nr:MAG: hypothetical protein CFE45_26305 [Burkholderiales bacterium PBB5]
MDIDEFNRQSRFEFERIRDFIILHYHLNQREDSAFWRQCREMPIPEPLQQKLNLYRSRGRIVRENNELFSEVGWLQVMHGQGLRAMGHHPLASLLSEQEVAEYLGNVSGVIGKCLQVMPRHADYIAEHCAAPR